MYHQDRTTRTDQPDERDIVKRYERKIQESYRKPKGLLMALVLLGGVAFTVTLGIMLAVKIAGVL